MTYCLQTVNLTKAAIDEVEDVTHLGSVVSTTEGTEQDVEVGWEKPEQFHGYRLEREEGYGGKDLEKS